MEFTSRDIFFSVLLHIALLAALTLINPFKVSLHPDFDSATVNLVTMPPLGNPELIKADMPPIAIPQATMEDEVSVPLSTPESVVEEKPVEKKKEQPKPKPPDRDAGYKGDAKKADAAQKGGADVSDQLGPGTKFGSVAVDNASFNYPYYFVQAFGKIQRNWSNPVFANQPLSCVIYFKILRSGTIFEPTIEKSSGVSAYDRACLRALQVSDPLPPLPTDFRDDIIGIHLEFPYKPR